MANRIPPTVAAALIAAIAAVVVSIITTFGIIYVSTNDVEELRNKIAKLNSDITDMGLERAEEVLVAQHLAQTLETLSSNWPDTGNYHSYKAYAHQNTAYWNDREKQIPGDLEARATKALEERTK